MNAFWLFLCCWTCPGSFVTPFLFPFSSSTTTTSKAYKKNPAQVHPVASNVRFTRTLSSSHLAAAAPPAISVESLSCSHNGGQTWQLKDVSYILPRFAKVALVGRNGTGKSTLLKIIAENSCFDFQRTTRDDGVMYTGKVTSPRDLRIAFVQQEPDFAPDLPVRDALLGFRSTATDSNVNESKSSLFSIVRRYVSAANRVEENPEEFTASSAAMDASDGWSILTKVEEISTRMRVRHLQDKVVGQLSGGEAKRVALAAALVQEPDVLLLDEPTNFLSLAGVQWLSDVLMSDDKMTILMVTHDRAFLNEVCDQIIELHNGNLYQYEGSYSDYLAAKDERIALEDAALRANKAKYKLELDWMRRQPQARETKQKARIDAFYKLEKATKPQPRDSSLLIGEASSQRIGTKILTMNHVDLYFGDRCMLKDFSYDFCKGDRICLAGKNGVGKTTFLRVLTGQLPIDHGEIEIGETVVIGVYDQEGIKIDNPQQTVLEFVLERVHSQEHTSVSESPAEARRLLQQFLFPSSRWNDRLSILSGGEKRRLQMLEVFSKRPNFLILDEPSVDCDLDTLQAMEKYLKDFDGVLIVVSHDRVFADNVSEHLFVFEGEGEIKDFPGTLSEYAATLIQLENDSVAGSALEDGSDSVDKKRQYKEENALRNARRNSVKQAQKDMLKIEKSIEKLKAQVDKLQGEINATPADAGWSVLADLTEQQSKLSGQIDDLENTWMELAELIESSEEQFA